MCDEYNTEVELVARNELDDSSKRFSGIVAKARIIQGRRYLTVMYSAKLGDCMADLCMDSYYVTEVRWKPPKERPLEIVGFGIVAEEQNEAYEAIQELLKIEDREEHDGTEEEEMTTAGPKRIEVELKQINSTSVIRNVVVTNAIGPQAYFKNYSLSGRIYKHCGTLERFVSSGMNSDLWKITQIKEYAGGFSSPVTTHYEQFSMERMDVPWQKVANFMKEMKQAEITVIEKWECSADPFDLNDDESDMYGYGGMMGAHYTQRVPYHYREHTSYVPPPPPVAMFRSAGDEIGTLLHQETCELEQSRPTEEREMDILDYLEKKVEAEVEESSEAEISASIEIPTTKPSEPRGTSHHSHGSTPSFCDCGSGSCPTCEENVLESYFRGADVTVH